MQLKYITTIIIFLFISNLNAKNYSNYYKNYSNRDYNYSIIIPGNWKKFETNLGYKHIIVLSRGRYTEIQISATKPDKSDLEKWKNWKDWYIKGIGARLRRIIETKSILIEKDIVGKVLLIEYTYRNRRVLQRVLISKFNDNLIVIECRSTINSFKRYINIFNVVMGSLRISGH